MEPKTKSKKRKTTKQEKEERRSVPEFRFGLVKKIRVFYSDPYATDEEDEEEARIPIPAKRVIREIAVQESKAPATKHPGVRQRPWGKWAAEIRDSLRGVRKWLGTFDTEEEAIEAYNAFAKKLEAEKRSLSLPAPSVSSSLSTETNSSSCSNALSRLPSPSSVLDVSRAGRSVTSAGEKRKRVAEMEEMPISELFDRRMMEEVGLDFGIGDAMDCLVGGIGDDEFAIGAGDLPPFDFGADGEDFSFLDSDALSWIDRN